MKRIFSNKYFLFGLGIILFFLIWWILSLLIDVNNMIIPTPYNAFKEMFILLGKEYTYKCILFTLQRVIVAFVISFVSALILGILAGNITQLNYILKPFITVLKSVPTAALIFMFAVLVGSKEAATMVTVLISFPILYEAVLNGILNVDEQIHEAAKIDGASWIRTNLFINVPLAIPYIIVGVLSSFSLSFKVEIMSEVITGSTTYGLGSAIKGSLNADATSMVQVFAYSLITIIIVLILTFLASFVKKKFKNLTK